MLADVRMVRRRLVGQVERDFESVLPRRLDEAPEVVQRAEPGLDGALANRLPGTLRDVIFKGPYVDCLVGLGSGQELTVSAPPETQGMVRGALVEVGWSPEAAAIFPADDA